ncbi:MAG: RidA family protein [Candidatus Spechtbacterales bacterium]
MKQVYQSSEESGAPLSGAVEVNGLVFISGQIHADDEWNIIGDSIEEKFEITVRRIEKILAEAELTLADVIRVHLYLTDLRELSALNKVYGNYFEHPLPARTAVGVQSLPLGATLEIDVIAAKNSD